MTKTQMVRAIANCKLRLNRWIKYIEVRPGIVDIPYDNIDDFSYEIVAEAYKWIQGLCNTVLKDVETTRKLLTEEQWTRYKTWEGFGDHQEVILMKRVLSKFRRAITVRKKPKLFIRTFTNGRIKEIKKAAKAAALAALDARHAAAVKRLNSTAAKKRRSPDKRTHTTRSAKSKARPK